MPTNSVHIGEPRNIAYDSSNSPYYSTKSSEELSYLKKENDNKGNPFAGQDQYVLFLTSMALAKYKNLNPKSLAKREPNISTNALGYQGRWLILGLGMSNTQSLTCLNDEGPLYKEAEKYANAGFDELKQLITEQGGGFSEYLECILRNIAEEFIDSEKKK